jgi:hypothetical protein
MNEALQSEAFRNRIKKIGAVPRVIWLVYIAIVPFYLCVAYMLSGPTAEISNPLTIPFAIISLLTATLAPYMPRQILPDSRLRELLNRQYPPDATLSLEEQRLLAIVSVFFVPFIVRLAFNESIALYGLVLAFGSRSFAVLVPFAIASLILNLMVPYPLDMAQKRIASLGLQAGAMPTQPG